MDLGFDGKTVVIAGGTAGMGFAAAEVLAAEGAGLALICRDRAKGEQKAGQLREQFQVKAHCYACKDNARQVFDVVLHRAAAEFGHIDALAVTAGPMQAVGSFEQMTDGDWEAYFDVQLMTSVRVTRAALPFLRRSNGTIVLTAAYSIRAQKPNLSAYAALKSSVASLSKSLARELASDGIRCNCICPGAIATEALDSSRREAARLYGELPGDEALDRYMMEHWKMNVAMNRLGRPREVGELIAFLLSDRAGYLNGAIINIDGGTDFQ